MNRVFSFCIRFLIIVLPFSACGGHGGGDSGDGTVTLEGQAFFPVGVSSTRTAVANSTFQILNFAKAVDKQLVAVGTTDSQGFYSATITESKVVAVIVSGQPAAGPVRVSGLISADPSEIEKAAFFGKDFDGITDVACEAGVTAIFDGSVSATDFSAERIVNLELAAALVEPDVNHFDPASVTAGAARVRALTDDGAHPPA